MKGPTIFTPDYYRRMRELEESGWWNAGMRAVAARMLDRLALPRRGTMIDVGCGSGQTMAWFQGGRPEWTAVGLDVARHGLEAARDLGETVVEASALDLPFPDECADLIITLDVLQHLPLDGGDRRALEEMHRVLRPGGHLFIRTNAQSFPRIPDDPEYDFRKYEAGGLGARIRDAGFTVLRISRVNALLGLAEVPRELRALRRDGRRYHGILSRAENRAGLSDRLKRRWLEVEGRAVAAGIRLPFGRSLVALCRR